MSRSLLPDRHLGVGLCLASATAFGLAAAIAVEAEAAGVGVTTMLTGRFAIAAVLFAGIARWRGAVWPRGRTLFACLAMGGIGYALQAVLYFSAIRRIDATLVALLLYLYPSLVVGLAVLLGRERAERRVLLALLCSAGGLALLLGGGVEGGMAGAGIAMAIGAAVTYALYITVAAWLIEGVDLFAMSALICLAAGVVIGAGGLVSGELALPSPAGLGWIAALAVVATVLGISAFFAGVRRVGASKAAVLSCLEPVVTAVTAVAVYGEAVTPARLAGGAGVLVAVLVVQGRRRRSRPRPQSHGSTAPVEVPAAA